MSGKGIFNYAPVLSHLWKLLLLHKITGENTSSEKNISILKLPQGGIKEKSMYITTGYAPVCYRYFSM